MLCGDVVLKTAAAGRSADGPTVYPAVFEQNWLKEELGQSHNLKLWFKKSLTLDKIITGIEQWLLPEIGVGNPPWTLYGTKSNSQSLEPALECPRTEHPKPDGKITLDCLSSVFISSANHEENQLTHLTLRDPAIPIHINLT